MPYLSLRYFPVQYVSSRFKRVRDISILSLSPSLLLYTFDSYGFVSLFFFFFFQLRNLNTTIETKRGNILEFSSFQVFHPIDRVIHLLHFFFFFPSQREKSRRRKKRTETLFLRSPLTFHSNSSVWFKPTFNTIARSKRILSRIIPRLRLVTAEERERERRWPVRLLHPLPVARPPNVAEPDESATLFRGRGG